MFHKFAITVFLLVYFLPNVHADEYRPAFLQIKQVTEHQFEMLWKVPARGDKRLKLSVVLPSNSKIIVPKRTTFVGNAFIERSTFLHQGELAGKPISIDGLNKVSTETLTRIEWLNGEIETARLTPTSSSFLVQGIPSTFNVVHTYIIFGIEHILQGIDHLLFIACLIFIARTWRRLLITITGFTLAHSVTLTVAALGYFRLPIPPIEAVIALSIVFLAREIIMERRDTLTWRYPISVSASFGLLHGFGFASALSEIGLPQTEIPAALIAFNAGVEIGQILFVAAILILIWLNKITLNKFKLNSGKFIPIIEKPITYGVGGVAMFWVIERTFVY